MRKRKPTWCRSKTEVRTGNTTFKFDEVLDTAGEYVVRNADGTVKTNEHGILLPKYDEYGRRITYTMKEKSINGYLSKIEQGSHRLINEYNGGRKLKFTVNKDWVGMAGQTEYPTITFTLHQVFKANGHYYVYNEFKREIRNNAENKVTFPDSQHTEEENALRYYSPVGNPFIYFVTETLSNYDGERVVFIEPFVTDQEEWAAYVAKSPYLSAFADKDRIELNPLSGQALGFTSSITEPLDERGAVANMTEAELNDTDGEIALNETVTNTYQPDESNFQGEIKLDKIWERQNEDTQNPANSEFDTVRAYNFTVSRKTRLSDSEILFSVHTIDSHSGTGTKPEFDIHDSQVSNIKITQEFTLQDNVKLDEDTTLPKAYVAP